MWNNIDVIGDEFRRTKLLGLWSAEPAKLLMAEKKIEKNVRSRGPQNPRSVEEHRPGD